MSDKTKANVLVKMFQTVRYAFSPKTIINELRDMAKIQPWTKPENVAGLTDIYKAPAKCGMTVSFKDKDKLLNSIGRVSSESFDCIADGKPALITYEENPRLYDNPDTGNTEIRIIGDITLQDKESGALLYFAECTNGTDAKRILSEMTSEPEAVKDAMPHDTKSEEIENEQSKSEQDMEERE